MLATFFGGLFALKFHDKLHLILGFSAGAVIGVAFFDLMPEALDLASKHYAISTVTTIMLGGFLLFMLLSRVILLHPHSDEEGEDHGYQGWLGAGSLSLHSFLDGIGIGLAFHVSTAVGAIVAAAVLAHDFSDGINTVGLILKNQGQRGQAFRWLAIDATAPFLGILATRWFSIPDAQLGLLLSLFCGFFLYIGASDLLPESHHQHPTLVTSIMTLAGAAVIFVAISFAKL
jgi:zinc transporter ZupT